MRSRPRARSSGISIVTFVTTDSCFYCPTRKLHPFQFDRICGSRRILRHVDAVVLIDNQIMCGCINKSSVWRMVRSFPSSPYSGAEPPTFEITRNRSSRIETNPRLARSFGQLSPRCAT